jgi:hypothetical protein
VSGAKPVFIRPYRFPPALKDEIENRSKKCYKRGLSDPPAVLSPLQLYL